MKYEHMTIEELQRRGTDDTEAMAELGRRFIDEQDPGFLEDELAGYKEMEEAARASVTELKYELETLRTRVAETIDDLIDDITEAAERVGNELGAGDGE